MTPKDQARLKYNLLKRLENYVYRHVMERMQKGLVELVSQNNILSFTDHDAFYFNGSRWPNLLYYKPGTPILHDALEGQAKELIDWYTNIVDHEAPLVMAFFRRILNHTDNVEEIFRLLPGALHDAVRDILNAAELQITPLPLDEVAKIVGASEKSVRAFKIRMMADLVGA